MRLNCKSQVEVSNEALVHFARIYGRENLALL